MKKIIFLLFISISFQLVFAEKTPTKLETMDETTNGITTSYKKKFKEAQQYIKEGDFDVALELFLELDDETDNPNLDYHIGLCYVNVAVDKNVAIDYLSKATEDVDETTNGSYKEVVAPAETYYYLAKAYHMNNNFDMAISFFQKYKQTIDEENTELIKDINHQIQMCETAKLYVNNPLDIEPVPFSENINTKASEYILGYIVEEQAIVYSVLKSNKIRNTNNNQNIYIAKYNQENQKWNTPEKYQFETEKLKNNSLNTNQIFFSKNGDIYSTSFIDNQWTEPALLDKNVNTKNNEIHACLSPTGTRLYFVSDREGGFGGYDIWYCERFGDKWGPAINIGSKINTEYDEVTPYLLNDGVTLYYSSKGHKSMGGFDVYVNILYDGFWSDCENVGYPVNTAEDDLFYIISSDEKNAYYSTTKPNSKGKKDIYVISL